tara:strand:- start:391 stop:579 length:189 start_codon:yes stop_codon:yes gene_type:complete
MLSSKSLISSKTIPVLSCITASFVPPLFEAIDGTPNKAASIYAIPNPSIDKLISFIYSWHNQ